MKKYYTFLINSTLALIIYVLFIFLCFKYSFNIAFFSLILLTALIIEYKKQAKQPNNITELLKKLNAGTIIILLIVFSVIDKLYIFPLISKSEIGVIFEKPQYKAKYYVNLFPENQKTKNYRVIADINAETTCDEYGEEDDSAILPFSGAKTYSENYKIYKIEKAYFENGDYITFDSENENNEYSLKPNQIISLEDDNDRVWGVELTLQKVANNKF